MRTLLILMALGWITSLPWTVVISLVLIAIAIAILWLISVSIERRTISPWSKSRAIDASYVAALEAMVADAETQVESLRGEVERLRATMPASEPDPRTALYRRVGLNENAPPWLISAARRAYRAALHPDGHPAHRKREAERRFKIAESVFDTIASSRS